MSDAVIDEFPAGACDSHIHVFDRRFPETLAADDMSSVAATAADYRAVHETLGTERVVIVTPRNYDVDNAVTLDAIAQLGHGRARGIATVRPDVSDATLQALHDGGVRGIRFSLYTPEHAPTRFDMVELLAERIRPLGWHLQLHWTAEQIVAHRALLDRLAIDFVFDHFARLPPAGSPHPAHALVEGWLAGGRAWLKLAAPYLDCPSARDGDLGRSRDAARYWSRVAPTRLLWGSDWPHTSLARMPGPAWLAATVAAWLPTPALRHQVLTANPARLYGFDPQPPVATHEPS